MTLMDVEVAPRAVCLAVAGRGVYLMDMRKDAIKAYRHRRRYTDEWWVAVDEKVMDAVMPLDKATQLADEFPDADIALLHLEDASEPEPRWIVFERDRPAASASPLTTAAADKGTEPTDTPEQPHADPGLAKTVMHLESRVEFLQNTVDAMLNMLQELEGFEKLRQSLQERAEFIARSEEELINRTFEFDELAANLEQDREDFSRSKKD
jgi:hypothetical protein